MDEYISRSKAINAIKSLESSMPAKDNYAKGYDAALGRALITVRGVPSAADIQPARYGKWIESKKHIWYKKPNGDIDFFAYSEGHCNGVICKKCGEHFCVYCNPLYDEENCECQHYICSECSSTSMEKKKFCPDCGARMDGDKANNVRNLTDEETEIYESWIDHEAKDTGVNIMDGDT